MLHNSWNSTVEILNIIIYKMAIRNFHIPLPTIFSFSKDIVTFGD